MIHVGAGTRVFVAVEPADFRCGIDGLAQVCEETLKQDSRSGSIFVFRNRARTAVKLLMFDGEGFWLCLRRLSKGRFKWWPKAGRLDQVHVQAGSKELALLLWNGDHEAQKTIWQPASPRPAKRDRDVSEEKRPRA